MLVMDLIQTLLSVIFLLSYTRATQTCRQSSPVLNFYEPLVSFLGLLAIPRGAFLLYAFIYRQRIAERRQKVIDAVYK